MPLRGVSYLVQRDGHQQLPEVIPVVKLEVAPLLPSADARIHALQHVLRTYPLTDFPSEMSMGEGQEVAEVMLPNQTSSLITLPRIIRPQPMDHLCNSIGNLHREPTLSGDQPHSGPPWPVTGRPKVPLPNGSPFRSTTRHRPGEWSRPIPPILQIVDIPRKTTGRCRIRFPEVYTREEGDCEMSAPRGGEGIGTE